MGKTVPSYRMALEFEIKSWKGFRKNLTNQEDAEAFDRLMDMCRNNAMAAGNACRCEVFEAMVMSILLSMTKRISGLEDQLNAVRARQAGLTVVETS